jgi:hypothetical protein
MDEVNRHPGLARVLSTPRARDALDLLSEELSGSDLTTLLLEVSRRRAGAMTSRDVLRRFEADRFASPGLLPADLTKRVELAALESLTDFELITCSPVVPLGTSSVVSGVSQNRLVSTIRSSEVNADLTTSLALSAALRRRAATLAEAKSTAVVRLASADRVVRAQSFEGERSFAHFSLLGLVSAGRDMGSGAFEDDELARHISSLAGVCSVLELGMPRVLVSDFTGRADERADRLANSLPNGIVVQVDDTREAGRGYYLSTCFKLYIAAGTEDVEIGDGGVVDWPVRLLADRKERMVISGLGLERVAQIVGVDHS